MKAVKKDVFDINKVTVVGSPTITSDGVASGFGAGVNYITTPSFNLTGYNSLVIKSKAKYTLSNGSLWWLQGLGIRLVIANSNGTLQLFGNSQILYFSKNEIGTPSEGDDIETITTITSTGATVEVIVDDVLYSKSATTSITLATIEKCGIGCSYAGYAIYANSIDLKQFSITVDGELVYSPTRPTIFLERRKEGFDLSKFTVVGSPTITEDGVASGFSSGNYIKKEITLTNNWGFVLPVKVTNETVTTQWISTFLSDANERICIIRKEGNYLYIQGFNGAVSSYAFTIPYVLNQTVYLKAVKNGTSLVLSYSNGLKNWIEKSFDLTGYTIPNVKNVNLGIVDSSWQAFLGSIDLSQFSITVDGKEVFTGAKEKFYAIGDF